MNNNDTDIMPAAKARALRKVKIGEVVSDKMDKTVIVEIESRVPHPKFKKIVKRSKRLHVHDENAAAKVGDKVRIVETRPLSKMKRWRILEVIAQ